MGEYYYIHFDNKAEGPFDLPAMVRKMRAHKIDLDTLLSDGKNIPVPAREFPEIAGFLRAAEQEQVVFTGASPYLMLREGVLAGWGFLGQNLFFSVITGALVLTCFLCAGLLSVMNVSQAWWITGMGLFLLAQPLIMLAIIRAYRGQTVDHNFVQQQVHPILGPLLAASAASSVAMIFGILLLLLPAVLMYSLIAFLPFTLLDKKEDWRGGIFESVRLSTSYGIEFYAAVLGVSAIHVMSLLLVITLPISLPITTIALAELYERRVQ